jgi:hypothetical protein
VRQQVYSAVEQWVEMVAVVDAMERYSLGTVVLALGSTVELVAANIVEG